MTFECSCSVILTARVESCVFVVQEENGSTGLHHAAKLGNLEVVMLLLSTGQVDLNAQVCFWTVRLLTDVIVMTVMNLQ